VQTVRSAHDHLPTRVPHLPLAAREGVERRSQSLMPGAKRPADGRERCWAGRAVGPYWIRPYEPCAAAWAEALAPGAAFSGGRRLCRRRNRSRAEDELGVATLNLLLRLAFAVESIVGDANTLGRWRCYSGRSTNHCGTTTARGCLGGCDPTRKATDSGLRLTGSRPACPGPSAGQRRGRRLLQAPFPQPWPQEASGGRIGDSTAEGVIPGTKACCFPE
jgi:hypothetical protein